MAQQPKSFDELYEIYKNGAQGIQPELTDFVDGSINDVQAGSTSLLAQEAVRILLDRFKITFLEGAEGSDLELLATDHYGDDFARPVASSAIGIVEFTRPTSVAGNVSILAGTIVKTAPDANGQTQRFETVLDVTMTGLTINASVRAVVAGPDGNVDADTITVIETALTDPTIVVNNDDPTAGGEDIPDDDTYLELIYQLIQGLKGATKAAIQSTALAVPGVVTASPQEFIQTVIEWNEATETEIGEAFRISRTKLYIADANGSANAALIQTVIDELFDVRACGVFIEVLGATAIAFDWDASITLNPGGPNFAELSTDPQMIIDSMTKYVQDFAIGGNFNRALARAAILAIWGPSGSDDLTNFETNIPTGDVDTDEFEKLIPDDITIS